MLVQLASEDGDDVGSRGIWLRFGGEKQEIFEARMGVDDGRERLMARSRTKHIANLSGERRIPNRNMAFAA